MEVDARMLKKYWSGQCTREEKVFVEAWLQKDVPDQDYDLRGDEELAKNLLWSRITEQDAKHSSEASNSKATFVRYLWPIAASILFILAFAIGTQYDFSAIPTDAQYVELIAADGKLTNITLADGSTVTLNSRSRLRYPKTFEGAKRHVILEGEGFFDIAKDPEKPFSIATEKLTVEVLGTKFNVKEILGQHPTITVSEGKVKVSHTQSNDSLILVANQQGSLTNTGLSLQQVNTDQYFAWKTGELILDDLTLAQATIELERRYGVSITVVQENLLHTKIRAVFQRESMPEVIRLIAAALDTSYQINNKEVTFGS